MSEKTLEYPSDVNAYQLGIKIGAGSSAEVFKAYCKSLNENVAVKKLNLEKSSSTIEEIHVYLLMMIYLFFIQKEIKSLSQSSHPNILHILTSFVDQNFLWLVLPLTEG
jgi:serine/threonine protein kinase